MMYLVRSLVIFIITLVSTTGKVKGDCESDQLELVENENVIGALMTYDAECKADGYEGNKCDTSGYQKACEEEGFDFFTYSGKIECEGYYNQDLEDVPVCFPKSCTMDEAQLMQDFNKDMTPEGFTNCKLDIDVEGLSAGFLPKVTAGCLALLVGVGLAFV